MLEAIVGENCCDLAGNALEPENASIVVFGATGDLAKRKIFPALYNLERTGTMPDESRIIGFARRDLSQTDFIAMVREACEAFSHTKPVDPKIWARFEARLSYNKGSFDEDGAYAALARKLGEPGFPPNALFYLATAPEEFGVVAGGLAKAGLGTSSTDQAQHSPVSEAENRGFRRIIVEKPFGRDLASARALTATLRECFAEKDIFRIDHYLGKETVQNLLYLRFANSIFEPLWSRQHIESVEIDVLETGGIGERGGYYDKSGAARDMLQNHLVQLLCLTAMEGPASLEPEAVRDEKVKVLKSIRNYSADDLRKRSFRGQYTASVDKDGNTRKAYADEAKVAPGTKTETFVSLRLEVDNWRFAGVPFTLRTGKALDRQLSEIRVTFKRPPATLFAGYCGDLLAPNELTIRIQPDEGIWLRFNAKAPSLARVVPKELRFSYRERGSDYFPEAYERLIADALAGDSTLFIRADEAEESWRIVDALEAAWAEADPPLPYPAGSEGPQNPADRAEEA